MIYFTEAYPYPFSIDFVLALCTLARSFSAANCKKSDSTIY